MARRIGKSQSYMALLESGRIENPDLKLLTELRDVFVDNCDAASPEGAAIRDAVGIELFVAALIQDWFRISAASASLLTMPVCDLPGLAAWERDNEADDLWIVAPNFVDNRDPRIRGALETRLKAGTVVTFFVRAGDRDFIALRQLIALDLSRSDDSWGDNLRLLPLQESELRWISSSFAIRNPTKIIRHGLAIGAIESPQHYAEPWLKATRSDVRVPDDADGYTIISQNSVPKYGFLMSPGELLDRTAGVFRWIAEDPTRLATVALSH